MEKSEMLAMLKELDPAELRVLKYEVAGGHSCTRSSSLYHCCGEARCEACHIPHLKQAHDEAKLYAYEKFVDKWQLTWQGYVPTKQVKKVNKNPRVIASQEPKTAMNANRIVDSVNDDNLEEVLMLLAKKLGRTV